MRSLPFPLAAADPRWIQPPPPCQRMSLGRQLPAPGVPLPRRHRTSGVAAAAAASSASFQTPRQTRRPSAEVSLNILTDAWDYGLTVVLSPIKV
jgi:hypothetical protein